MKNEIREVRLRALCMLHDMRVFAYDGLQYIILQISMLCKWYTAIWSEMRWECGAVLTASSPYHRMLALWGNAPPRGKGNMDYLLGCSSRPFCRRLHESPGAIGSDVKVLSSI